MTAEVIANKQETIQINKQATMSLFFNDPFFADPFTEMRRMQRDMDRLWTSFSTPALIEGASNSLALQGSRTLDHWRPLVDVKSTDKEVIVHAELPGVKKEDIVLELKDGILSISGSRTEEKKEENETYHRSERYFGTFSRSIAVPKDLNENDIRAHYDNGVLEVSFPKPALKQPEKKAISIQ